MLYWISRIFRQAFGFRQVDRHELRCTVCRTLHRDAGPLVEGLDNFLVCTSCVQRLSETEPLPVEAEGTEFVSSARSNAENPYEPPTIDRNSRVCIFCNDRSKLLRTLDNQYFACADCVDISKDLLKSASEQ